MSNNSFSNSYNPSVLLLFMDMLQVFKHVMSNLTTKRRYA